MESIIQIWTNIMSSRTSKTVFHRNMSWHLESAGKYGWTIAYQRSKGAVGPISRKLTEKLYPQANKMNKGRYRWTIESILFSAIIASEISESIGEDVWFKYSRRSGDHLVISRYNIRGGYEVFIKVLERLINDGYLYQKLGSYNRDRGRGNRSMAIATPKLKAYIHKVKQFDLKDRNKELIILKDDKKNWIDYEDTDYTRSLKRTMSDLRRQLWSTEISLTVRGVMHNYTSGLDESKIKSMLSYLNQVSEDKLIYNPNLINNTKPTEWFLQTKHPKCNLPKQQPNHTIPTIKTQTINIKPPTTPHPNDTGRPVSLEYIHYPIVNTEFTYNEKAIYFLHKYDLSSGLNPHMVFNKDFEHGGRIYMGLLNIQSEIRKHITFDGQKLHGLDYSALHIRMLYNMKGYDYTGDPYENVIAQFPTLDPEELRKLAKIVALVMINATEETVKRGISKQLRDNHMTLPFKDPENRKDKLKIDELIIAFKKAHASISNYFNTGIGLSLQNKDKDIAIFIVNRFLRSRKTIFPIHDGFYVKEEDKGLIWQLMEKAYIKYFGFKPKMKWEEAA